MDGIKVYFCVHTFSHTFMRFRALPFLATNVQPMYSAYIAPKLMSQEDMDEFDFISWSTGTY